MALKQQNGFSKQWSEWPKSPQIPNKDELEFQKYLQFVANEQLSNLTTHLRNLGITSIGNVSLYSAYDSADARSHPDLFQLDKSGNMTHVAAVPPDYYEPEKGQLWGNPLWRWGLVGPRKIQEKVFEYMSKRFLSGYEFHNVLERDHSRGYTAYGRVNASETTAKNAKWTRGPGNSFLEYLEQALDYQPKIIDENLGVITKVVRKNLKLSKNPGMRILQFIEVDNPNKDNFLENTDPNTVFYTGTQNNENVLENVYQTRNEESRRKFLGYLSQYSGEPEVHWKAIDATACSNANWMIYPMQDALGYGFGARMNRPQQQGYWRWRMTEEDLERFRAECSSRLLGTANRHRRIPKQN
jgi:4-alpha-glucanotransferase